MSRSDNRMLVVIGASAGGLRALKALAAQLPADFPAPVFVVSHISPAATGDVMVNALNASGGLACG